MNRQGCREALTDLFLYVLPVYLPFYQALLADGIARAIQFLLFALLLMFLASNRAEIGRAIASGVRALCPVCFAPVGAPRFSALPFVTLAVPDAPCLSALFQRPPPLFA